MATRRKVRAALGELSAYHRHKVLSEQAYQEYQDVWRKVVFAHGDRQLDEQLIALLIERADEIFALKQQEQARQDDRAGETLPVRIPWNEISRCRSDTYLQGLHSLDEAKERYLEKASTCPKCGTPPADLAWLYFLGTRQGVLREGGWMTVCDRDQLKVDYFIDQRELISWEEVDKSRNDAALQARYPPHGPRRSNQLCPKCGRSADELTWIWYESSDESWRSLAGWAGWLLICDACRIQVDFNLIMMS